MSGITIPLQKNFFSLILILSIVFVAPATGLAAEPSGQRVAMSSLLTKGLAELIELDVAIATGTLKPLKLAPSVATVITSQDIEDMGATTLDEVLETVPGLHVQPGSGNIFSSIWSIRGIYTQLNPQVLLLIDGQPLKINSNGAKPFVLRMPVSMISRIEIIRGPGSAVLGADAFAGAINIITKEGNEINGMNMGIRGGSFGSYDVWAQHGGTYNGWDVAFSAEYAKGDGDHRRIIEKDALGSGPPSLTPGPIDTHHETFNAGMSARKGKFTFRLYNSWMIDNGLGAGISGVLNDGKSNTDNFLLLGSLSYKEKDLLPDFDLTATVNGTFGRFENTFFFLPEHIRRMIGMPGGTELNSGLELGADYRGFINHRVRLSLGTNYYTTDTFQHKNYGLGVPVQFGSLVDISDTPYVYMKDQHRSMFYAGIQDEWSFAKGWELTTGVRYDRYSDFGSAVNPRIAVVWSATPELTAKLMYGRAFRAPAFSELYNQNNPAVLGNTNLEPETIDMYEFAFDYRPTKRMRLGLNLFKYRINGLIDYVSDPAPAASKTAQNARDQKGQGVEIEAEWQATNELRFRANYSYQRSFDETADAIVPDVPAAKFYVNAHWKFMPDWSLDGQYFWIGSRHRAVGDIRSDLKAYDLVNMTLQKKNIAKHWDFSIAVRNLFDSDNREPSPAVIPNDFPLEHRSFWAELRYHF
ncbi:MAG: TonB-dependent receptor [Nitrospirae bacterium]|nr:TonB-dependent receptor [Nitrospirota bacterium]